MQISELRCELTSAIAAFLPARLLLAAKLAIELKPAITDLIRRHPSKY